MELQNAKVGFIGFGNMAQAMAQGWVKTGALKPEQLYASARNVEKLKRNTEPLGIHACASTAEAAEQADVLVVAVKPYQISEVLAPLKETLQNKIVVSVAVNYPFESLKHDLLPGTAHLSTLPNTPVSIGEGITIVEQTHSLDADQYALVETLLSALGLVQPVETAQMSTAGTLSGCGPAFASMFIEALADGAVKHGLPRDAAYQLASQMIAGTGKLQRETGMHPGAMKDAVTSPGGTTIKGVTALEKHGFRGAVIEAFDAIEGE